MLQTKAYLLNEIWQVLWTVLNLIQLHVPIQVLNVLLIAQKVLLVTPYAYYSSMLSYTVLVIFPFIDHVMAQQLSQRLELN